MSYTRLITPPPRLSPKPISPIPKLCENLAPHGETPAVSTTSTSKFDTAKCRLTRALEYIELSDFEKFTQAEITGSTEDEEEGSELTGSDKMAYTMALDLSARPSRPTSVHAAPSVAYTEYSHNTAPFDGESSPQLKIVSVMSLADPQPSSSPAPTSKPVHSGRGFSTIDEAETLISAEIESEEEDDDGDVVNEINKTDTGQTFQSAISEHKQENASDHKQVKNRPIGTVAGTPVDKTDRVLHPKPMVRPEKVFVPL